MDLDGQHAQQFMHSLYSVIALLSEIGHCKALSVPAPAGGKGAAAGAE